MLNAMEKRAMESELKAQGIPRQQLTKIVSIANKHFIAALEHRKGFLARLFGKAAI